MPFLYFVRNGNKYFGFEKLNLAEIYNFNAYLQLFSKP